MASIAVNSSYSVQSQIMNFAKDDPIMGTKHLRFPIIVADVKNKNYDVLYAFLHEIHSKIIENYVTSRDQFFNVYLRKGYFDEIMKQSKDNLYGDYVSANIVMGKFCLLPCFHDLEKRGENGKEYDIMTNNTCFYWIPLLRKVEKKYESENKR